jgi:hypothetical protein
MAHRPVTVTDTERTKIIAAIKAGDSSRTIAKRFGRSTNTIAKISKAAGVPFSRPGIETATRIRKLDNAARRAILEAGMLDDAIRLRAELFAPTTIHNFGGRDNTYASENIPQPTITGKRELASAIRTLTDGAANLAKANDNGGVDDAIGLLGQLGQALGLNPPHPTDTDGG